MKISTNKVIKALNGEDYKAPDNTPLTLGKVIAEGLANDTTSGKHKLYILAEKAYNSKTMEVDSADLALIKKSIEACKTYNTIILGQALGLLEEVK